LDAACSAKKFVASTVKIDKVDEKTKMGLTQTHTQTAGLNLRLPYFPWPNQTLCGRFIGS
jgi:hypothetical protein